MQRLWIQGIAFLTVGWLDWVVIVLFFVYVQRGHSTLLQFLQFQTSSYRLSFSHAEATGHRRAIVERKSKEYSKCNPGKRSCSPFYRSRSVERNIDTRAHWSIMSISATSTNQITNNPAKKRRKSNPLGSANMTQGADEILFEELPARCLNTKTTFSRIECWLLTFYMLLPHIDENALVKKKIDNSIDFSRLADETKFSVFCPRRNYSRVGVVSRIVCRLSPNLNMGLFPNTLS